MRGQTIILSNSYARAKAHRLLDLAPLHACVNISEEKRSDQANRKMWAMLSDISRAKPEGRTLTPDVWKALFMHALDHSTRFEMAIDGKGMVPVGFRSSHLTKPQMSELIESMYEFGARHNVQWTDEAREAA